MVFHRISLCIFLIRFLFCTGSLREDDILHGLLGNMNSELLELNKISAKFEWESAVKPSQNVSSAKRNFYKMKTQWKLNWCDKFSEYRHGEKIRDQKMIDSFCRGPKYSPMEARQLTLVFDKLLNDYQSKTICRIEENGKEKCYHGEPDLKKLLATSRNESELRWAWTSWRNEMSQAEDFFIHSVFLQNQGARRNGYKDIGEYWREEMDIPELENFADELWRSVRHLYRLLHAVVRFRLRKLYPNIVNPTGLIPAHLLGDLWSQNWMTLIDILLPSSSTVLNITKQLQRKKYSVNDMAKKSEDFYMSLGLPPMTKKFWKNSLMVRVNDSQGNCHGSAANMFEKDDFRILGCFEVNEEDFHVIRHEMGHVQYYMAYQDQPAIFRNGINSAFHESIGDTISLGVMTPQHLQRLGLADDKILTNDFPILLRQALAKIPQIPHALVMEKWRWRMFEGKMERKNFNKVWWKFHRDLMGIEPSTNRDGFFDPAAKFHIISSTSYIRYFFAYFLQFQIFQGMCEAAVTGKIQNKNVNIPLHKCDIYGSRDSGKILRNVMKMGSSLSGPDGLAQLTGSYDYTSQPLLKYFEPVQQFLQQEIELHGIPVGWE